MKDYIRTLESLLLLLISLTLYRNPLYPVRIKRRIVSGLQYSRPIYTIRSMKSLISL